MRCLRFLFVALLLTLVYSAVEPTLAGVGTLEHASPAFHYGLIAVNGVRPLALLLVSTVGAQQVFLHLPAVAFRRNPLFAGTTESLVTRSRASVLTARHYFVAHLATTPSRVIVGVRTSLRHFMFATEANLSRTHMCTGRTRSSVACKLAGVWTFPGSLPATSLTTGMRRNSCQGFGIFFLFAPTCVLLR